MQGGIHPDYTGQTYLDILSTVRTAVPQLHIHAFSPLEVWQGAETLGISLREFLEHLKEAGLSTLPGTAAEILDDEAKSLCPDKINTSQWLEVMKTAHQVGFKTTATIMYGHIESPIHWSNHLTAIRELQQQTGGFTEFVPLLPYVPMEAPMYLKGKSRRGPSFREAILIHSISRIAFEGLINNILNLFKNGARWRARLFKRWSKRYWRNLNERKYYESRRGRSWTGMASCRP